MSSELVGALVGSQHRDAQLNQQRFGRDLHRFIEYLDLPPGLLILSKLFELN